MNGYCEECDKKVEFHIGTVSHSITVDGDVCVYLNCPWCEEKELITIIEL